MFEVVDIKSAEYVKFTSTKKLMYGDNIIRVEVDGVKFIDESHPFKWSQQKKYIYLNSESFTKLTQPSKINISPEIEWER